MKRKIMIITLMVALLMLVSAVSAQVWEEWVARYDGLVHIMDTAKSLAVDVDGNVYVSGNCIQSVGFNENDFVTIKYNSFGYVQWIASYSGLGNYDDIVSDMVIDDFANVYVTGRTNLNMYDTSNYVTIKYNSYGDTLWISIYSNSTSGYEMPNSIAVGGDGCVYVTGNSYGYGTMADYATVKYSSDGEELWSARYNGYANLDDEAQSIAVDSHGDVYVTGYSWSSDTADDFVTIKYNSSGIEQWIQLYDGPTHGMDRALSMTLDCEGNVIVTGYSSREGNWSDYATIKYNSAGEMLWIACYDNGFSDIASYVIADSIGNIYITGQSDGEILGFKDHVTIKYSSDGEELWENRYNGPSNQSEQGLSLATDNIGNLYVTGTSSGGVTLSDFATIKYDSSGVEQWIAIYNGPGNGTDYPNTVAVLPTGEVFVGGTSVGEGTSSDYCTIKYSQSGPPMPVVLVSFTAEMIDSGVELNWQTASEMDCYGWKVERRQGEEQYQDVSPLIPGYGTTEEPHNYSYIDQTVQAGETYEYRLEQIDIGGSITFSDPITVSLPPITAVDFHLHQNSPNPFNATTVIGFSLPVASMVKLDVFDINGRNVGATLCGRPGQGRHGGLPLHDWMEPGQHHITFDGSGLVSGIYIYRLTAGEFVGTGKMVLLK
ncbi:hypothetical protein CEE37_11645 [candidate division LCP-89 bacterium B3_LCP]|uniref:Fibronectin type-III domain-containing protein n=1 Tax=candidate division LCP-89 bacterium B3_LCP TaxID=2012998 RepID=A0A532UVV3_UNCL8|nr:MAG: hypothetical protein CEE37_11645 [candidate division LCP-89 bacterium B3_LCP]